MVRYLPSLPAQSAWLFEIVALPLLLISERTGTTANASDHGQYNSSPPSSGVVCPGPSAIKELRPGKARFAPSIVHITSP
ncbi:hypothetical protein OH76DRAFT_1402218 [Lentinus brumalis]|uniref:Uncharacterized protein n=1 Tax=Lentinus brumalis TaxID=2498619 RepID=A0A371DDK5_9APHY|nr:hypothetical protein OH76DRAFT_1402218 [Polyporus brumalis]